MVGRFVRRAVAIGAALAMFAATAGPVAVRAELGDSGEAKAAALAAKVEAKAAALGAAAAAVAAAVAD